MVASAAKKLKSAEVLLFDMDISVSMSMVVFRVIFHDHEYEEKMDIDTDIDTAMERWHSTETFKSTEMNPRHPIYMEQSRFYCRDSTNDGIVRIWGLSGKDDMLPFFCTVSYSV